MPDLSVTKPPESPRDTKCGQNVPAKKDPRHNNNNNNKQYGFEQINK